MVQPDSLGGGTGGESHENEGVDGTVAIVTGVVAVDGGQVVRI